MVKLFAHGSLTLEEIISKSCNVGIVKAMRRLSSDRIYHYMNSLGFGEDNRYFTRREWRDTWLSA